MKVEIGGVEVTLAAPVSVAARLDVVLAVAKNSQRAMAAALGLCWQSPNAPGGKYDYDVMRYGGAVLDDLIGKRALPPAVVFAACAHALELCSAGLYSEAEVADAAKNSEAGEDPAV